MPNNRVTIEAPPFLYIADCVGVQIGLRSGQCTLPLNQIGNLFPGLAVTVDFKIVKKTIKVFDCYVYFNCPFQESSHKIIKLCI